MENYATQIKGLTEERAAKIASLDALVAKMSTEKRAFTDVEQVEYDKVKKEVESFNSRISVLEDAEKRELQTRKTSTQPIHGIGEGKGEVNERAKMVSQFSFKRAIEIGATKKFDGVEGELSNQERKDMMERGVDQLGNGTVLVPAECFAKPQRRDMTATGTTSVTGDQGGISIQTDVQGLIDVFLPNMVLGKLPVVKLNNLRGNVKFPQASTLPAASWTTENATGTEKSPLMSSLSLSPKRLAAYIQLSNQLLQQSEANINAYARRFLINAQAIEFEKVCLKGGGSNEPTGILGGSYGSTIYAGGAATNGTNASGARPLWDDIVNLVKATKAVNAPDGQAYITSPAIAGRLQITPRQSSGVEGNFILRDWNSGVNGFPLYATTNLPDTFSKGGSTVLSAIIFGDFSNFVMASWGGMELGVDPYVNMKEGLTNIVLNSYVDCGMLNVYGFAAGVDFRSY